MGYSNEGEIEDLVNRAQEDVYGVTRAGVGEDYVPLFDSIEAAVEEMERAQSRGGDMVGVPTGFSELDEMTHGLHGGQFVILAARPAVGKSTLALDLARNAAIKHKKPVIFFSLEMGRAEIAMRLLSAESRIYLQSMRKGSLTDNDWQRLAGVRGEINSAPLYIDDSPNLTLVEIRAKCRRMAQRVGLEMIVIDYIQLMTSGKKVESRQQEVSEFSRALKLLAKELNVPVVAISQLNRNSEKSDNKVPEISQLRESGSLEQDADVVILLHREAMFDREHPRAGEADLILAKQRNGPTGTIVVNFLGQFSKFEDPKA
jgi:replicative DNA helicase